MSADIFLLLLLLILASSPFQAQLLPQSPPPVAPRNRPPWPAPPSKLHDHDRASPRHLRLQSVGLLNIQPSDDPSLAISRSAPPMKAYYSQVSEPTSSQHHFPEDRPFGHRYPPSPTTAFPRHPLSPTTTSAQHFPPQPLSPPPAVPARPPPPMIMMPVPVPTPPRPSPQIEPDVFQHRAPHPPRVPRRKPSIPANLSRSNASHTSPKLSLPRRTSLSLSPTQPPRKLSGQHPPPDSLSSPRTRSRSSSVSRVFALDTLQTRQLPQLPPSSRPIFNVSKSSPPPLPERVPRLPAPAGPREWTADERLVYQAPDSTYHSVLHTQPSIRPPPPPPSRPAPIPVPSLQHSSQSVPDDSDEEEDELPPAVSTSTNLSRGLSVSQSPQLGPTLADEMPDATFANRRPPVLSSTADISIGSPFTSFALRGYHLCTGHHTFKLWNSQTGECVSQVNSLQDVKITAMEFKPGPSARYIWCGTKDGQVFEYDCQERRMMDSKASLHSAPVVGIFRCKSGGMCSLDESAKVQIWTSPSGPKGVRISGVARAQRVAEKTNFSIMLAHQLWTASGPSNSKSASALAQRSPSIRVYDPDPTQAWTLTPRPLTIPGGPVGAVTAGTVIPAQPHLVYLAHESGHISVWDRGTASAGVVFKRLVKVSNYQITAMQGVTKYLWAGFRTGNVYVYETTMAVGEESKPWKVLKVWKAHKESITRIVVDPSVLWEDVCWDSNLSPAFFAHGHFVPPEANRHHFPFAGPSPIFLSSHSIVVGGVFTWRSSMYSLYGDLLLEKFKRKPVSFTLPRRAQIGK